MSIADYLAMENQSDEKHEYHAGEIFGMSGGTLNHSLISMNLGAEARRHVAEKDCRVFDSNLRVWIEAARSFVYPDAMVICGTPNFYQDQQHVITNPKTVFEVLSDSTSAFDRGGKFKKYQTLASLEEYVIVEQTEAAVDVLRRGKQGLWEYESYLGLEAQVQLKSLGISLPMSGIYHKVEFPDPEKSA